MDKRFGFGLTELDLAGKLAAAEATVRRLTSRNAEPETAERAPDWLRFVPTDVRGLIASKLPPALKGFAEARPATPTQGGGRFLDCRFSNAAGTRPYKLFVPGSYHGQMVALVVMLHGCTQSPEDFAAGTGMNVAAETEGCLVAYPAQPQSANPQKCWNWFNASEQRRDGGEPALIAGITREIMALYAVDPARVYVAGLSAGGAAASIMAETYPDLYAAVGVHSGLACGAAHDMVSAMAAMRNGAAGRHGGAHRTVPTIVFHGDRDTTVSPVNADAVVAQSPAAGAVQTRSGQTPRGHRFECRVRYDEAGAVVTEQWTVQGAGHAWSGGSTAGSYTDPRGPDATGEMLRFFREHPHPCPG